MAGRALSICIPTYNFGAYIAETLHSVLGQDGAGEVEIVVVDGASTDNTAEIVHALQLQYPQISYHRLSAKGGIDRDMARAVEWADGDYCWLLSSDDTLKPGALRAVLNAIRGGHDLYLCRDTVCTVDMIPRAVRPALRLSRPAAFSLADAAQRRRYFALARNTVALFSYMSVLIVRRAAWNRVALNEAFTGSCWAHAARFFELMQSGLSVHYLAKALVNRRPDNDSFLSGGLVKRYRIAIDGYHRMGDYFFGHESYEALQIRRVIRAEFGFRAFFLARLTCHDHPARESRAELDALVEKTFCDTCFSSFINKLLYKYPPIPGGLFLAMRRFWRRMRYKAV